MLLDYIDIIVHVQHAEERIYYSLERIWKDCPAVDLPDEVRQGNSRLGAPSDGGGERRPERTDRRAAADRPLAARPDGLEPRGPLPGQHRRRARRRGPGPGRPGGAPAGVPGAGRDRLLRPRPGPRHRRDARPASSALEVQLDPRLRETYGGAWQGKTVTELSALDREAYAAWRSGADVPAGGGERRTEVAARVCPAIVEAAADGAAPAGTLVVVTHGGSARAAIGTLLDLPLDRWAVVGGLANCCWSVLEETGHGPVAGGWSSTTRAACRSR